MPKKNLSQKELFSTFLQETFPVTFCQRCNLLPAVGKFLVLSPGEKIKRFLFLCSNCKGEK
ncbi:hypothetical protein LCGC14_1734020 [marine sediment metagenome]|uniref:Uncharacterized protein n=1 Tax=marine sediment metagenome TaxID=412755 RepID=A0A0F9H8G9_9ZZZZ